MLNTETRYVLRYKDTEKIISINNAQDQAYWSKYLNDPEYTFTEVKVSEPRGNVCLACES